MSADLLTEDLPSRYVVGIDLGTTNSAVCYVDYQQQPWKVRVLEIPQLVAPNQLESRDTLPSFHYQPPNPDPQASSPYIVGFMARDYGSATPGRLISSAKSWLCHGGVDRTAELLPWHAASDVERISPVEASSRYLAHIRTAWNERFKADPLEQQDVVLTLPASFDEIARELTVEAAAKAGLPKIVLIEEPQAAFYAWIYKHQDNWDQLVSPGQKILVCDIGGGTTDFTLIRVRRAADGKVQFHRVAVGDHLLLGGDNMDLALARHLETKLSRSRRPDGISTNDSPSQSPSAAQRLQPRQWETLLRLSRQAKEQFLTTNAPEQLTISLPGTGSQLLGGSLATKVTRNEARELLVDGFLPRVPLTDKPSTRRSGFQEFGLPFAADPAITRYLAAFLTAHRYAGDDVISETKTVDPARPDIILFNGGVFESTALRERLIGSLSNWFSTNESPWQPNVLDNDRLDLAVARGAAYYGMVRRGEGVKIVASLARTYYIGIESQREGNAPAEPTHQALCLVPGNAEPGQTIELPNRQFDLTVSEPVEFPLYTSSVRLTDRPGELVPFDPEQMAALPPIRTALKTRSRRERGTIAVRLNAKLTEIGTLELWCSEIAGDRTWRLQFDVRSATQTDIAAHETAAETEGFIDEATTAACRDVLESVFGQSSSLDPNSLIKQLVAAIGSERPEWPTSLLRRIWEILLELEPGRRKSAAHEARWLNLLGYALRPGYGLAVDDWRVAETWKTVQGKLAHGAASSRTESLILWRRIAGGLSSGQQRALAQPLLAMVKTLHKRQLGGGKGTDPTWSPHEGLEILRLLGSLELLAIETKIELARILLDLVPRKKLQTTRPALYWAIGRLGAREPAYGPLNTIVPPAEAADWINRLLTTDSGDANQSFALVNLARRTHDRFRDLDEDTRHHVLAWLTGHQASEHSLSLVRDGGQLDAEEQGRVFGEALPKGLRLR
jgi:molecular chaperone DnaK (HSP70)